MFSNLHRFAPLLQTVHTPDSPAHQWYDHQASSHTDDQPLKAEISQAILFQTKIKHTLVILDSSISVLNCSS